MNIKNTIVESAVAALKILGSPSNVKQIYAKIMERKLYKFGAKDPIAVLRVQLERHTNNTTWGAESKVKVFSKDSEGKFDLLSAPLASEPDSDSSVDTLQLVKELANKLKQDTISRIVDHLYALEPEEFENFCCRFLERYGFDNMSVTPRGRDGGIDVHGKLAVGISKLDVAAQCKRFKITNKVTRPDISQFRGDIQGEFQQGIFITTSSFTKEAKDVAFKIGCVPIVLIDGSTLAEIMIDRGIGVSVNNIPIYDFEIDLV